MSKTSTNRPPNNGARFAAPPWSKRFNIAEKSKRLLRPADVLRPGLVQAFGDVVADDVIGHQLGVVGQERMLDSERPANISLIIFWLSCDSVQSTNSAEA